MTHAQVKKWTAVPLFCLISSSLLLEAQAMGKKPTVDKHPDLMVFLGDSMTAASLADTYSGVIPPWPRPLPGDGLVGQPYENKSVFSWATGRRIESHFEKLRSLYEEKGQGDEIFAINLAEPGVQTDDLLKQAKKVVAHVKSGKFRDLVYVGILMGNNDACSIHIEDHLQKGVIPKRFKEAFDELSKINQATRINVLVSSIPKIADLGRDEIRSSLTLGGLLHCRDFYDSQMFYCPALVNWRDEATHLKKEALVDAVNDQIRATVEQAKADYPQFDFYFSDVMQQMTIHPGDLAIDCFHPNAIAQNKMAQLLWQDLPWFK